MRARKNFLTTKNSLEKLRAWLHCDGLFIFLSSSSQKTLLVSAFEAEAIGDWLRLEMARRASRTFKTLNTKINCHRAWIGKSESGVRLSSRCGAERLWINKINVIILSIFDCTVMNIIKCHVWGEIYILIQLFGLGEAFQLRPHSRHTHCGRRADNINRIKYAHIFAFFNIAFRCCCGGREVEVCRAKCVKPICLAFYCVHVGGIIISWVD